MVINFSVSAFLCIAFSTRSSIFETEDSWKDLVERILHPGRRVRVSIVGKYTHLHDAYKSLTEALVQRGRPLDPEVLHLARDLDAPR